MPEIIRRGKTREERVVGLEFSCYKCSTTFRLIEGDDYRYKEPDPGDQFGNDVVYLKCPVCENECSEIPRPKR